MSFFSKTKLFAVFLISLCFCLFFVNAEDINYQIKTNSFNLSNSNLSNVQYNEDFVVDDIIIKQNDVNPITVFDTNRVADADDFNGYIVELVSNPLIVKHLNEIKTIVFLDRNIRVSIANGIKVSDVQKKSLQDMKQNLNNSFQKGKNSMETEHYDILKYADLIKGKGLFDTSLSDKNIIITNYYHVFNGFYVSDLTDTQMQILTTDKRVKTIYRNYAVYTDLVEAVDIVNANDVWQQRDDLNQVITGKGLIAAVLDTGIDYTHPDLGNCTTEQFISGNCLKVIGGYDFANNDDDPIDDQFHGTHVAATIAGNGVLKGIALDANLLAYKVLNKSGNGNNLGILGALNLIVENVANPENVNYAIPDVINMSLGSKYLRGTKSIYQNVFDALTNVGVTLVVSAGNSGAGRFSVGDPGVIRSAITVGAIDKNLNMAKFSSRGPVLLDDDSSTEEPNVLAKPDIVAPGVNICAALSTELFPRLRNKIIDRIGCVDSDHFAISGTSMSSPVVAGNVLLLLQRYYWLNPKQVKEQLQATSKNIGFQVQEQGSGLIDINKAVSELGVVSDPGSVYNLIWRAPRIDGNFTFENLSNSAQVVVLPEKLNFKGVSYNVTLDTETDFNRLVDLYTFDLNGNQINYFCLPGKDKDTFKKLIKYNFSVNDFNLGTYDSEFNMVVWNLHVVGCPANLNLNDFLGKPNYKLRIPITFERMKKLKINIHNDDILGTPDRVMTRGVVEPYAIQGLYQSIYYGYVPNKLEQNIVNFSFSTYLFYNKVDVLSSMAATNRRDCLDANVFIFTLPVDFGDSDIREISFDSRDRNLIALRNDEMDNKLNSFMCTNEYVQNDVGLAVRSYNYLDRSHSTITFVSRCFPSNVFVKNELGSDRSINLDHSVWARLNCNFFSANFAETIFDKIKSIFSTTELFSLFPSRNNTVTRNIPNVEVMDKTLSIKSISKKFIGTKYVLYNQTFTTNPIYSEFLPYTFHKNGRYYEWFIDQNNMNDLNVNNIYFEISPLEERINQLKLDVNILYATSDGSGNYSMVSESYVVNIGDNLRDIIKDRLGNKLLKKDLYLMAEINREDYLQLFFTSSSSNNDYLITGPGNFEKYYSQFLGVDINNVASVTLDKIVNYIYLPYLEIDDTQFYTDYIKGANIYIADSNILDFGINLNLLNEQTGLNETYGLKMLKKYDFNSPNIISNINPQNYILRINPFDVHYNDIKIILNKIEYDSEHNTQLSLDENKLYDFDDFLVGADKYNGRKYGLKVEGITENEVRGYDINMTLYDTTGRIIKPISNVKFTYENDNIDVPIVFYDANHFKILENTIFVEYVNGNFGLKFVDLRISNNFEYLHEFSNSSFNPHESGYLNTILIYPDGTRRTLARPNFESEYYGVIFIHDLNSNDLNQEGFYKVKTNFLGNDGLRICKEISFLVYPNYDENGTFRIMNMEYTNNSRTCTRDS